MSQNYPFLPNTENPPIKKSQNKQKNTEQKNLPQENS